MRYGEALELLPLSDDELNALPNDVIDEMLSLRVMLFEHKGEQREETMADCLVGIFHPRR